MTTDALFNEIIKKQSYLCVGLDTDLSKIPSRFRNEKYPLFEFNKQIIDATADFCVAYKPNIAFYESLGANGWENLEKTLEYIPKNIFTIADAKRGDIGNTSALYAKTFFETYAFDSVTVAPYMGKDSVTPFLSYPEKFVILLALTSNEGSTDFQFQDKLYEKVIEKAQTWASPEALMFVVGATHPEIFADIRRLAPDNFLLVPGYGAQGGDLATVSRLGMNKKCGLLVNSSRGVIFAENPRLAAQHVAQEMKMYLDKYL